MDAFAEGQSIGNTIVNDYYKGVARGNEAYDRARKESQERLADELNGYTTDTKGNSTLNKIGEGATEKAFSKADIELQEMRLAFNEIKNEQAQLKSMQNAKSMTGVVTSLAKGNVSDANMYISRNPILKEQLLAKGITGIQAVDFDNDIKLLEGNPLLDTTRLSDPAYRTEANKMFFKVRNPDGSYRISNSEDLYKVTGTHQYTTEEYNKKMQDGFAYTKKMLADPSTANPDTIDTQSQVDTNTLNEKLAVQEDSTEYKLQKMAEYAVKQKNPKITWKEVESLIKQEAEVKEFDNKAKLLDTKTQGTIKVEEVKNENRIELEDVKNKNKLEQINLSAEVKAKYGTPAGAGTPEYTKGQTYAMGTLKHIYDGHKVTLDNTQMPNLVNISTQNSKVSKKIPTDKYTERFSSLKNLDNLLVKMDKVEKLGLMPKVSSIVQLAFKNKDTEEDILTNGANSKAIATLGVDQEIRLIIADYVKAMSGASYTDAERKEKTQTIRGSILGGGLSLTASIENFMNYSRESIKSNMNTDVAIAPSVILQIGIANKGLLVTRKKRSVVHKNGKTLTQPTKQKVKSNSITEERW